MSGGVEELLIYGKTIKDLQKYCSQEFLKKLDTILSAFKLCDFYPMQAIKLTRDIAKNDDELTLGMFQLGFFVASKVCEGYRQKYLIRGEPKAVQEPKLVVLKRCGAEVKLLTHNVYIRLYLYTDTGNEHDWRVAVKKAYRDDDNIPEKIKVKIVEIDEGVKGER